MTHSPDTLSDTHISPTHNAEGRVRGARGFIANTLTYKYRQTSNITCGQELKVLWHGGADALVQTGRHNGAVDRHRAAASARGSVHSVRSSECDVVCAQR